uniref:Iron-sulfur cluster carrier protein n=1 Tax=Ignisphaera aggregans TaxID=334771 RepID=A0A7C2ZVG0_9CREN
MLPRIDIGSVKHVILVMSGKGGVGKSFISASIALALKELGLSVGILDADVHGPSIPWLLGIENTFMGATVDGKIVPVEVSGIAVASFELMLEKRDEPIAWRGPLKTRALMEVLAKTSWGPRDFIVVDMPPGTGDEHLTIIHVLRPWIRGSILVLTPGKLVEHIVAKARKFLAEAGVDLLGAVLNMAFFQCPTCGSIHRLYGEYSPRNLEILAEIPVKPGLSRAINDGKLIDYLYSEDRELMAAFVVMCRSIVNKIQKNSSKKG